MTCIFCAFANGDEVEHREGTLFEPIHETENTISFLSIERPAQEFGHILIIPKEHYQYLEELPSHVLREMIDHVALACRVTRRYHEACNVLLNNGPEAGQCVLHTHFHIVPRDPKDGIKVELWNHNHYTKEGFHTLTQLMQKEFDKS